MASEISIKINLDEYPRLKAMKKKDLDKSVLDIFNTGYIICFPDKDEAIKNKEYNEINKKIESLRKQIEDSDFTDIADSISNKVAEQIAPLNASLAKLLGLQTASSKKGELGENIIQNAFITRYGDLIYEDKSKVDHCGDAWVTLPNKIRIIVEVKNYINIIPPKEIEKMENDMKTHHIKFSLFLGMNNSVQGFREMDFHTFSHQGETYFSIIVANLSNDITKLDLAFGMIRKLIDLMNDTDKFPWIQNKIKEDLNIINEMVLKNTILRDGFYDLENDVHDSLNKYHKKIRDYQYDMETTLKRLANDITGTMTTSLLENKKKAKEILLAHKDKKIYSIVSHISDVIDKKNWELKEIKENNYELYNKGTKIGNLDVQLKKAIINFPHNQLDLIFNAGNNLQNNKNLKILETNF